MRLFFIISRLYRITRDSGNGAWRRGAFTGSLNKTAKHTIARTRSRACNERTRKRCNFLFSLANETHPCLAGLHFIPYWYIIQSASRFIRFSQPIGRKGRIHWDYGGCFLKIGIREIGILILVILELANSRECHLGSIDFCRVWFSGEDFYLKWNIFKEESFDKEFCWYY